MGDERHAVVDGPPLSVRHRAKHELPILRSLQRLAVRTGKDLRGAFDAALAGHPQNPDAAPAVSGRDCRDRVSHCYRHSTSIPFCISGLISTRAGSPSEHWMPLTSAAVCSIPMWPSTLQRLPLIIT